MYNTMQEVLLAVREKYSTATSLSNEDSGGCYYKHTINGIGCSIGCLYPADVAEQLDDYGAVSCWSSRVWAAYKEDMFGPKIKRNSLSLLQRSHDRSDTVEQFLFIVDYRIATGHWLRANKARELLEKEN